MSARTTSQTASSLADDVAQLAAGGDAALARTVAAHGRPALDAVVPLFAGRWRAQVTPGTMIRLIRGPEVIARLAELARNLELEIQPFAAAALGHTRDAEALAPLLAMLDAPFTTEVAARALGELGRVDALGPLVARWHGLVGGAQLIALAEANAELAPMDAIAVATGRLRLGDDDGDGAMTAALVGLTAADAPTSVRVEALRALRWSPRREAAAALRTVAASTRDGALGQHAIAGIAQLGIQACVGALVTLIAAEGPHDELLRAALVELVGDEVEVEAPAPELRRWWMRSAVAVAPTAPRWRYGDLGASLHAMAGRNGGSVRTRVELWTNVDFVDIAEPGVAGDPHDVVAAVAWWVAHGSGWQADQAYRAGRIVDAEAIADGLAP